MGNWSLFRSKIIYLLRWIHHVKETSSYVQSFEFLINSYIRGLGGIIYTHSHILQWSLGEGGTGFTFVCGHKLFGRVFQILMNSIWLKLSEYFSYTLKSCFCNFMRWFIIQGTCRPFYLLIDIPKRGIGAVRTTVLAHLSWKLSVQNHWANFNQTWHKSSLGGGDSSLLKRRG
jgi:hypothetical protein